MTITCANPHCGKPAPDARAWHVTLLASIHDVVNLVLGKRDAVDCPFCAAKDSIAPSLAALSFTDHCILHLDRGAGDAPLHAIERSFGARFAAMNLGPLSIRPFSDLAEFHTAVTAQLRRTAHRYPLTRPVSEMTPAEFAASWRDMQGEVFTALIAGSGGAIRGFKIELRDVHGHSASPEEVMQILTERYEQVMVQLLSALRDLGEARVTLEEILFRMVDTSPLAAGAAERVLKVCDATREHLRGQNPEELQSQVWLQLEVLYASLCRRANQANAFEAALADLLLRMHIGAHFHESQRESIARLALPAERIHKLISLEHARGATGRFIANLIAARMDAAEHARFSDAARHAAAQFQRGGDLYFDVLKDIQIKRDQPEDRESSEHEFVEFFVAQVEQGLDARGVLLAWRATRDWGDEPDAIERLAIRLLERFATVPPVKAQVLSWLGERMKDLGMPARALRHVKSEPQPWEESLSADAKRSLWTERSNALRLLGDNRQALAIAQSVLTLLDDAQEPATQGERGTAWLNVGILLRDTGEPFRALDALNTALGLFDGTARSGVLESIAVTLMKVGNRAAAAEAFFGARQLVSGRGAGPRQMMLTAYEAIARWNAGQHQRARRLLDTFIEVERLPVEVLPSFSVMFAAAQRSTPDAIDATTVATARALVARAVTETAQVIEEGNSLLASALTGAAASLAMTFSLPDEDDLWRQNAAITREAGQPLLPVTAVELARIATEAQDEALATAIVDITLAITAAVGHLDPDAQTLTALDPLDRHFDRLCSALWDGDYSLGLIQTVQNLRRNAHQRAIQLQAYDDQGVSEGELLELIVSPEDCTQFVAEGLAPFAVLEWIDVTGGAIPLLTHVTATEVVVDSLSAGDFSPFELTRKVTSRLMGWRVGRAGEPFEVPDWAGFQRWLWDNLEPLLPRGGHVIVIDHATLSALPFHIALAPKWTTSYAADWAAVHAAARSALQPHSPQLVGVACAPRSNESEAVLACWTRSVTRTETFATRQGLETRVSNGVASDRAEVTAMIAVADVAKILCHGQVSRDLGDVGLLVAHGGHLPPGNTFAAQLPESSEHRLGWRELATLPTAAPVVFLGACSGGKLQVLGMDERISAFSSLAKAGTRSLIAPRWKIDVELALPILDDCLEAHLRGVPLCKALQQASRAALDRGTPAWQAHAFTIEGGWV